MGTVKRLLRLSTVRHTVRVVAAPGREVGIVKGLAFSWVIFWEGGRQGTVYTTRYECVPDRATACQWMPVEPDTLTSPPPE